MSCMGNSPFTHSRTHADKGPIVLNIAGRYGRSEEERVGWNIPHCSNASA